MAAAARIDAISSEAKSQLEQTGGLEHSLSSALHKSFCLEGAIYIWEFGNSPFGKEVKQPCKQWEKDGMNFPGPAGGQQPGWAVGAQAVSQWRSQQLQAAFVQGMNWELCRPQQCHCSRIGPCAGRSQLTLCCAICRFKSALISVMTLETNYKNSSLPALPSCIYPQKLPSDSSNCTARQDLADASSQAS